MRLLILVTALILSACGQDGSVGERGLPGPAGQAGPSGSSSVIRFTRFTSDPELCAAGSGVWLQSFQENMLISQALICDGAPGEDAEVSPFDIVELIVPCPEIKRPFRETLLRLASGQILASFSDNVEGRMTRLSLLVPGTYMTTDGSGCVFTITAEGQVY